MKVPLWIMVGCIACGCNEASTEPTGATEQAKTSHGYLGLMFESIDNQPLVVSGCVPGGGAESAGVQAQDVLVRLDDQDRPSFANLLEIIAEKEPGDTVVAVFERSGVNVSIPFPLMSFDDIQTTMEAQQDDRQAEN